MDINALFTKDGMRDYTAEQRDTYINDGQQLRQMERIFQARLAQISMDGDRAGAAGRRARRLARKVGKVATFLEKAAAQVEALNAAYVHDIVELPARRARALEAKDSRRQRLGIAAGAQDAIAKSLTRTTDTLNGTPTGNPQVTPTQAVPQYVSPYPHQFAGAPQAQPLPDIADVFNQEAM